MSELSDFSRGDPCKPPLIFLHGFLGCKEDWEGMIPFFEDRFFCVAYDLPGHGSSLYCDQILQKMEHAIRERFTSKPLLIGYSLGGRIGLQLQKSVSGLVALSSHLGLATDAEREARWTHDCALSEELLTLPFEEFLAKWYAQPLFGKQPVSIYCARSGCVNLGSAKQSQMEAQRPNEEDHSRIGKADEEDPFGEVAASPNSHNLIGRSIALLERRARGNPRFLSAVLKQMSLAHQPRITAFFCPILLLYGEEDLKYRALYCKLPEQIAKRGISSCGHALHLDNPSQCAQEILRWIEVTYANT